MEGLGGLQWMMCTQYGLLYEHTVMANELGQMCSMGLSLSVLCLTSIQLFVFVCSDDRCKYEHNLHSGMTRGQEDIEKF